MKQKSEAVCKLLGIGPKIGPSFDNGIIQTSDLRAHYPDLTNPVNFVKLLKCLCAVAVPLNAYVSFSTADPIQEILDETLTRTCKLAESDILEKVKQKAALTAWVY